MTHPVSKDLYYILAANRISVENLNKDINAALGEMKKIASADTDAIFRRDMHIIDTSVSELQKLFNSVVRFKNWPDFIKQFSNHIQNRKIDELDFDITYKHVDKAVKRVISKNLVNILPPQDLQESFLDYLDEKTKENLDKFKLILSNHINRKIDSYFGLIFDEVFSSILSDYLSGSEDISSTKDLSFKSFQHVNRGPDEYIRSILYKLIFYSYPSFFMRYYEKRLSGNSYERSCLGLALENTKNPQSANILASASGSSRITSEGVSKDLLAWSRICKICSSKESLFDEVVKSIFTNTMNNIFINQANRYGDQNKHIYIPFQSFRQMAKEEFDKKVGLNRVDLKKHYETLSKWKEVFLNSSYDKEKLEKLDDEELFKEWQKSHHVDDLQDKEYIVSDDMTYEGFKEYIANMDAEANWNDFSDIVSMAINKLETDGIDSFANDKHAMFTKLQKIIFFIYTNDSLINRISDFFIKNVLNERLSTFFDGVKKVVIGKQSDFKEVLERILPGVYITIDSIMKSPKYSQRVSFYNMHGELPDLTLDYSVLENSLMKSGMPVLKIESIPMNFDKGLSTRGLDILGPWKMINDYLSKVQSNIKEFQERTARFITMIQDNGGVFVDSPGKEVVESRFKENIKSWLSKFILESEVYVGSSMTSAPVQNIMDMYTFRVSVISSSDKSMSDLELDIRVIEGVSTIQKVSNLPSSDPKKKIQTFDVKYKTLDRNLIGKKDEIASKFIEDLKKIPYVQAAKVISSSPILKIKK